MTERPQTSTVQEAMHAAAAAEEILTRHPYNAKEVATYLGTIIDAVRSLKPHQAEDVQEHIRYRARRIEEQSQYRGPWTTVEQVGEGEDTGPDGIPNPDAEPDPRAEVDALTRRVQSS